MGWFSDLMDSVADAFSGSSSDNTQYNPNIGGADSSSFLNTGSNDSDSSTSGMSVVDILAQQKAEREAAEAKAAQEELERRKAAEAQAEATRLARLEQERRRNTDAFTSYLTSKGMLGQGLNVTDEQASDYFQQETALKGMLADQGRNDFRVGNVGALSGNVSGDFAGGDFTGQYYYDIADDFGALAMNILAPKVLGALGGELTGTIGYDVTGNPMLAGRAATGVSNVVENLLGRSKIADTVQLADGTIGYVTNFAGKQGFTTRDAVTERNIALALENQNADSQSDSNQDIASGIGTAMAIAGTAGSSKPSWRDYYSGGFKFDPTDFAKQMLTGTLTQSNLKSVQLAGRIAGGEDIGSAAFGVYGDELKKILPEGYETTTQAAIRIGMGENRVDVLGDVYGADLNLDNPLGKAGIEALSEYDKTGDTDKALAKGVYKYIKEDGKLPSLDDLLPSLGDKFNTPDNIKAIEDSIKAGASWVDDTVNDFLKGLPDRPATAEEIKSVEDFLRSTGSSIEDVVRAGGKKAEDFVRNLMPKVGGSFEVVDGEFDFSGLDLPDADFGWLEDLLKSISISTSMGQAGKIADEEDEFVSLEEDEDLLDPTRSLARELLGMEQTKSVQQAQENA